MLSYLKINKEFSLDTTILLLSLYKLNYKYPETGFLARIPEFILKLSFKAVILGI